MNLSWPNRGLSQAVIVVALVCLRYAVLAELEDDMREIGTMKAIGIPGEGISGLYLGKIRILAAAGCTLGLALGKLCASMMTGHISRTFGSQPSGAMERILPVLTAGAMYGIILLFSRKILSRLNRATVIDLLVTEQGFRRSAKVKSGPTNFFSRKNPRKYLFILGRVLE